jgi:signal transduction histidine kinase
MRLRSWFIAALGLGSLLALVLVSVLASSRKAQQIYRELNDLNAHHQLVDVKLRRLRSDVNLSGIFVRDYLLDVARERAPEYREQITAFRESNVRTLAELRELDAPDEQRIATLELQLDQYWATFEPLFAWTASEKIFKSATFLRQQVVPRREAVLTIAQEIEELNNANLAAQQAEVTRQQTAFRADLYRLLWRTLLLGMVVAVIVVLRLRSLERRSDEQRAIAQEAELQMRQLSQQIVATQEEERKHLSRELHDHVGQVLTGLRMELSRIERIRGPVDVQMGGAVAECKRLVDNLVRTVRDLSLGLRPSMLDDFGLQAALEWLVRDVRRRSSLRVQLEMEGEVDSLPDRHRTCVYRVVQEALTNCVRHAQATTVAISVAGRGRQLVIVVADDGVGMSDQGRRRGLGLRGIEERVKELQGSVTIGPGAQGGTRLVIRLPWLAGATTSEGALARAAG